MQQQIIHPKLPCFNTNSFSDVNGDSANVPQPLSDATKSGPSKLSASTNSRNQENNTGPMPQEPEILERDIETKQVSIFDEEHEGQPKQNLRYSRTETVTPMIPQVEGLNGYDEALNVIADIQVQNLPDSW